MRVCVCLWRGRWAVVVQAGRGWVALPHLELQSGWRGSSHLPLPFGQSGTERAVWVVRSEQERPADTHVALKASCHHHRRQASLSAGHLGSLFRPLQPRGTTAGVGCREP